MSYRPDYSWESICCNTSLLLAATQSSVELDKRQLLISPPPEQTQIWVEQLTFRVERARPRSQVSSQSDAPPVITGLAGWPRVREPTSQPARGSGLARLGFRGSPRSGGARARRPRRRRAACARPAFRAA